MGRQEYAQYAHCYDSEFEALHAYLPLVRRFRVSWLFHRDFLRAPEKVTGAGVNSNTMAFVHETTVTSVSGNLSVIDHPLLNGDANAIVVVTHNANPGGGSSTALDQAYGVQYTGSAWAIFLEDGIQTMPTGVYFNVLVIKP